MSQTSYPPPGDVIARAVLISEAVEGFEITIDGGGSTFSIAPGILRFVAINGGGRAEVITLNYPGASGVTPIFPEGNNYLTIDRSLNLTQNEFSQTYQDLRENVLIGLVITTPGLTPFAAASNVSVSTRNLPGALFDLRETLRPIRKHGLAMSPSGNNDLQVQIDEGEALVLMHQGLLDPEHPNVNPVPATLWTTYIYVSRDSAGGFNIEFKGSIDPNKYDNNNLTTDTVQAGYWTIQRLYILEGPVVAVQYSQHQYCTPEHAMLGLTSDPMCKFPPVDQGLFAGYLLVQQGTTDLSDTSKALFINPHQTNGEYGVTLCGEVTTGNVVVDSFTPPQGNIGDMIFCPEYQSFSNESQAFTTSNNWVTHLTESVTVQGGTYIIHYGSEIGQSVRFQLIGFRFTVDGTPYNESIDGVSSNNAFQLRNGFVELDLVAGTYIMNIDFGQTGMGGTGTIKRSRFYLEKVRK